MSTADLCARRLAPHSLVGLRQSKLSTGLDGRKIVPMSHTPYYYASGGKYLLFLDLLGFTAFVRSSFQKKAEETDDREKEFELAQKQFKIAQAEVDREYRRFHEQDCASRGADPLRQDVVLHSSHGGVPFLALLLLPDGTRRQRGVPRTKEQHAVLAQLEADQALQGTYRRDEGAGTR